MFFKRSVRLTSNVAQLRCQNRTGMSIMFKWILVVVFILSAGCTSFNAFEKTAYRPTGSSSNEIEFLRGRPNKILDGVGNVIGIPNKLVLLDERANNHHISAETESAVSSYLTQNQMQDVLVRVNQYDPIGEWRRMADNDDIRPIWRMTVGNFNLLKYTFLPGRLTGGDWYNPYTDTLNLYSDIPALAISEAAYAYDIRTRLNPGAYAAAKEIPIVGLAHGTTATRNAIAYYENNYPSELHEARQILEPNNGANWGGQLLSFLPFGTLAGRLVGSGVGRIKSTFF